MKGADAMALTRIMVLALLAVLALPGQTFNSGSNGSDGALNIAPNLGVIVFDPATNVPPLDVDRDGVFHFTTITIGSGTHLRLTQRLIGGPVTFLAQGAVLINGTLDLDAESGVHGNSLGFRVPAQPGAGGYYGGVGGSVTPVRPASPGLGPAGGQAGIAADVNGKGGGFTANTFLVPLVGGSGGGGAMSSGTNTGPGGGAGGGAILIASSVSITLNNNNSSGIFARGGTGGNQAGGTGIGGGGAGGGIRLMAPRVEGNALVRVGGANGGNSNGGGFAGATGRIRIEAFQHAYGFSVDTSVITSSPFDTFVSQAPSIPTIRVVSIAGQPVRAVPTGAYETPDVSFNSAAGVPVILEAKRVPLTAAMRLTVLPEDGPDIALDVPNRTGTLDLSTVTVNVVFPTGFSRGFLRATVTQ